MRRKKIFSCLIITGTLLTSLNNFGQNIPVGGAVTTTNITPTLPTAYNTNQFINYVRVWEPQKPMTDPVDVTDNLHIPEEVQKTTQYSDGLGRPIEAVA